MRVPGCLGRYAMHVSGRGAAAADPFIDESIYQRGVLRNSPAPEETHSARPATPRSGTELYVQQQMFTLPGTDYLQEHLVLGLLDDRVGGNKRLAKQADQRLAILKALQGVVE